MPDARSPAEKTSGPLLPGWRRLFRTIGDARRATHAIGCALILFVGLGAAGAIRVLHERAIEDWRGRLGNLSLIIAQNASQTMAPAYLVLDSIAEDVRKAGINDERTLAQAFAGERGHDMMRSRIRGLPQIDVVAVADAHGGIINFSRTYPVPPIDLSDRNYFEYHRNHAGTGTHLSQPVRNEFNGKWTFHISRRLNDAGGKLIGIAIVGISCDFFTDFFKSVNPGKSAAITLYRQDYTVLARWPMAEEMIGKRNLAGSTFMAAEHGVERYPLIVNLSMTDDMFLGGWRQSTRFIGGVTLASIVALIIAFSLMSRLLRRRKDDARQALQLKARAAAANEAQSRFLAMIDHEIRTPINGILDMSELLLETRLDDMQKTCAGNVLGSARDLRRIIDDVLDFSQIEANRFEIQRVPFDPVSLTRDTVDLRRASAARKRLHIDVLIDHDASHRVHGDPIRIGQVLGNLLDNAIKFTPSGRIAVSFVSRIRTNDTSALDLTFSVVDDGIGISKEAQRQLFEPFTRGESPVNREHGGTGLGLAICKRLVELMHGRITCVSTPGAGSRFTFHIRCPIAERPAPATASSVQTGTLAALPEAPAATADTGNFRVLVAEDTEMNRQLVRALLTRMGCEVELAENGLQALTAIENGKFDLVLMDCLMPVMDGYEATTRLRAWEARTGALRMPIIALTANAVEGDRERCTAAGMDDYLAKPFTAGEFMETVDRWMRLAQAS